MADPTHILFLYGNDEYAISQRLAEFKADFPGPSEAQMNTVELDARSMLEEQWIHAVQTLPFLAGHRLVTLGFPSGRFARPKAKRPQDAGDRESKQEFAGPTGEPTSATEQREKFLQSLLGIPPTTLLVIWEYMELRSWGTRAEQEKQDRKHWLVKWIQEHGFGLERHALPMTREMPAWIVQNARTQGGEVVSGAATRLSDLVGTDTRQAAQEVTKLLTYVNWSRPVTAADVDTLSPLTAEPDVFAMVDALGAGDSRKAQRLLHRLLEVQDAFGFWGMIIRQFRLLVLAREVLDAGGGEAAAVKAMGVVPFVARKAMGQARNFSMPRLEMIYHRLLEMDEDAKTGRMPLDVSLDLFVAELAG